MLPPRPRGEGLLPCLRIDLPGSGTACAKASELAEPLTFEEFKKGLCRRGRRGRTTRAGDRPGRRGLLEDFILMKNKCGVASPMVPRTHAS